jgi:hypothetical protein
MNFMNRKMFQAGGGANALGDYQIFDKATGQTTTVNPGFLQNITLKSQIAYPLINGYKSGQLQLGEGVLQELDTYRQSDEPFGASGDISSPTRVDDLGTAAFDLSRGFLRAAEGPMRGIAGFLGEFAGSGQVGDTLKDISSIDFSTGKRKEFEPAVPTREENRSQILEELVGRELALQTPITDFQQDIEQIQAPTPIIAGEDQSSFDFRDEDMRSKVGQSVYDEDVARREREIRDDPISQTLGIAEFDLDERRKAFEESMEGKNEFGELIPTDRPPTPNKFDVADIRPELLKVDLSEMQPESLSPGLDEIDVLVEDILPEEIIVKNKFDVTDIRPELAKVDLSTTESDLDKFNDAAPPQVPKQTTGIFGSDRFLDFIRNVGGELARTGQMGEGLATGAAKAAEERTARELLKAQEDKKFEDAKKLLEIEANLTGTDPMSVSDLDKIKTNEEELSVSLRDFKKSENTLSNLNTVIKILDSEDATGFKGFFGEATDMIESAIKSDTGKSFDELEPRTRANALLKVLRQANVREILGESGKTISNLDREIVEDVFGDIKLGTPRGVSLKKLKDSRQNIISSLEQARDQITSAKTFFDNARFNSPVYAKNYDLIQLINNFNFDNALNYIKDATGASAGITDIGLAPDA